ncbi:MAG: ribonuclease H-like domain-containing protein [Promethearchaeota archaeon]
MIPYYFDIETYSILNKPDPENDKIITIQYQKINLKTGEPIDKLVILKEWKSSEKDIVTLFYNKFLKIGKDYKNKWKFVPVGFNLNFEWEFIIAKVRKYLGIKLSSKEIYYDKPRVDLQPILVLLNGGVFRGASLDKFSNKPPNNKKIKGWYENKLYHKIEQYIENEVKAFLDLLCKIIKNIHKLLE